MPDALNLVIPSLGESVAEATIAKWLKADGDPVGPDDIVAELETDKAAVELPAGAAGIFKPIVPAGATVKVGDVVAHIDPAGQTTPTASATTAPPPTPTPTASPIPAPIPNLVDLKAAGLDDLSPAVRALVIENKLQNAQIPASGPGGRLTKEDVLNFLQQHNAERTTTPATSNSHRTPEAVMTRGTTDVPLRHLPAPAPTPTPLAPPNPSPMRPLAPGEERHELSKLRQTIARRLVEAQHATASLTTFNEVDMSAILALREKYKDTFEKMYGIGLGFMSFFAKAVICALRTVPDLNNTLDGNTVIKRLALHLGIAVATDRGLMVPIIRNANALSMAQIESEVKRLANKARDGKITVDELAGGTFSITNGGVYGSLLSTPILNPPQSGILGMHKIQKRAVVVQEIGKDVIAIRPMMYLALTYDHRLIDGRQSVTFLVKVKEALEDPTRILLDV